MLKTLEVIWVFDRLTEPQKWKMMVCLSWDHGWFLRINTSAKFRPCVPISQALNPWLGHDSHVECNLLILDEYEVEESLKKPGNPVGRVDQSHRSVILQHLLAAPYHRSSDKLRFQQLLG